MVRHFMTTVLKGLSHWVTDHCAQDDWTSVNP